MKTYIWQGINSQGFRVSGQSRVKHLNEVKNKLRQDHITLLKVRREIVVWQSHRNKISFNDISLLVREMAALHAAGVSLLQALQIIQASINNARLKKILVEIESSLKSGQYLSYALRAYPQYFDPVFCSLIVVGEQTGTLDSILTQIATQREKLMLIKQKLRKALFYPLLVLLISSFITLGLLLFVVPQFENLFTSVGAQLPLFTRIIIVFTQCISNYLLYGLIILALLVFSVRFFYLRSSNMQLKISAFILKVPVIGSVLKQAIFARCLRVLATTLIAGLSLLEALQLVSAIANNKIYATAFLQIAKTIKTGQLFNQALAQQRIFPSRIQQMIAIGEQAGCLDQMLTKLADYYEQRLDFTISNLTQFIEPVIMVFLALVVGCLVIAMYLPIFRIGSVL